MTTAVLCFGLRENSRIKLRLNNQHLPSSDILSALTVDKLSTIIYQLSGGDADKPELITPKLLGKQEAKFESFTPEEFVKRWNEIQGD